MTGGVIALASCWLLGARRGKYNADGTANAIPGHNIPMALAGTLILMFGWFGFTAGATLDAADSRITVIAANAMLASAAGCVAAMLYMYARSGKPDPSMLANGALAGLVAITAPCAFVAAPAAVLIGAVAGVLVCISVFFVERRLRLDDPVGAISVHGVNGLWGVLAIGLFADGTYGAGLNGVRGNVAGLFYGDPGQLVAEAIGGLTNLVAVGTMTVLAWNLAGLLARGHRVSAEAEEIGLDLPEIGALAYPDTTDLAAATVLTHTPGAKRAAA
jgi:Amt family ammonium transporter